MSKLVADVHVGHFLAHLAVPVSDGVGVVLLVLDREFSEVVALPHHHLLGEVLVEAVVSLEQVRRQRRVRRAVADFDCLQLLTRAAVGELAGDLRKLQGLRPRAL